MNSGSFKNLIKKMFTNHKYSTYMYKQYLALDSPQWLTCLKTKPNQTKPNQT